MNSGLSAEIVNQIRKIGGEKLLRDLVELYLEHTPGRLEALAAGLRTEDPGLVERSAHSIRSSSVSLGASAVAEQAALVERLARSGGYGDLSGQARALEERVHCLLASLQEEYAGGVG